MQKSYDPRISPKFPAFSRKFMLVGRPGGLLVAEPRVPGRRLGRARFELAHVGVAHRVVSAAAARDHRQPQLPARSREMPAPARLTVSGGDADASCGRRRRDQRPPPTASRREADGAPQGRRGAHVDARIEAGAAVCAKLKDALRNEHLV